LPVLLELLRQEDPKVRLLAVCGLGALGERALPAFATLRQAVGDQDEGVRWQAARAMKRIEVSPAEE
jgi:HEAT repeat protein